MKAALAAALALALAGPSAGARTAGYRILLTSNRDGTDRWYSVRPDGSGLAPLLPPGSPLRPYTVSGDGSTVAYLGRGRTISVSRASGAGVRRIPGRVSEDGALDLSGDGKLIAFSNGKGLWAIATQGGRLRRLTRGGGITPDDWSPDRKAVLYDHEWQDRDGSDRSEVVLRPLDGNPRVLARASSDPNDEAVGGWDWSPDGRWLAYLHGGSDGYVFWLVRPDGTHRHRVLRGVQDADWSPDGKRLVLTDGDSLVIGDAAGRRLKRLHVDGLLAIGAVTWAPDGRHFVLGAREDFPYYPPEEIWTVGLDGKGLRRLTSRGNNGFVGVTRLDPVQPMAPPVTPAERVVAAGTVATTAPVAALSADGGSVAFVTKERATDCDHVAVWTPADGSLRRFGLLPAPCAGYPIPVDEVVFAGSRVAWTRDTGAPCEITLYAASFAQPVPAEVGYGCTPSSFHAHGDGDLLVFDNGSGLMRVGAGTEQCQPQVDTAGICATLRRGDHAGPVESVSGGLIAVHEPGVVAVLDERGQLVRVFPFVPDDVSAARLDGGRLVVWRFGGLEVYDVATGTRVSSLPMPAGYRLVDVDGGIAVLLSTNRVLLLRLADGRSLSLQPGQEPTLADLEPPGLYSSYATGDGGGRVVFMPRSELVPQLDGGSR
jgi:Tol biopolymer transport system component